MSENVKDLACVETQTGSKGHGFAGSDDVYACKELIDEFDGGCGTGAPSYATDVGFFAGHGEEGVVSGVKGGSSARADDLYAMLALSIAT